MSLSSFPILSARTPRLTVPSRQYFRNASGSPTRQQQQHFQQHVDDLISQLTPTNAVSALRHPTGPLKTCLDMATASEQSFAMRAALASSSIQEWLDELSDWDWPEGGGSSGFEEPKNTRMVSFASTTSSNYTKDYTTTPTSSPPQARTLSPTSPKTPKTPERQILRAVKPNGSNASNGSNGSKSQRDSLWMGSLLASDVHSYERRISDIAREVEDLEVEDMKQHVLHHHILRLSPPNTPPMGGAGRLRQSASSASLSTLTKMDDLTAVVTAIVLQALPLLSKLTRLLDVWRIRLLVLKKIPVLLSALSAADTAIQSAWNAISLDTAADKTAPTLRREDYNVIKSVVEGKVSRAAQITDFMLDSLDGWEDTIPEKWIDRIDAAEREYGEWVAACERKIREGEWKRIASDRPILAPPVKLRSITVPAPDVEIEAGPDTPMTTIHNEDDDALDESMVDDSTASLILPETPERHVLSGQSSLESLRSEPELPSFKLAKPPGGASPSASVIHDASESLLPSDMDIGSDAPVARGLTEKLRDDMSNMGDVSYLSAGDDLEPLPVNGSPSSSPPDFKASMRSTVTFNDMPTVAEHPEESPTGPKTPLESSFMFDDLTNDDIAMSQDMSIPDIPQDVSLGVPVESPLGTRRMSVNSEDDQLQQQISEILESIPAKIHLSSQPSPSFSHLNPPDFKLPMQQPRKPRTPSSHSVGGDGTAPRSLSSMSTRSMTPSFLLAPAYARKPRQQRGNQDIKLYHLSRSTGEAPIKLFIRLVGESGERVMVRVGGGWADLSEYLKEYASHHSRRSKSGGESAKIEIRDLPVTLPTSSSVATSLHSRVGSSPPSRPGSAMDRRRPESPLGMPSLNVRKVRRAGSSLGDNNDSSILGRPPQTPLASVTNNDSNSPSSGGSGRSRSSSAVSWTEEDSSLGMSGPRAKNIEMSDESKAWVESVKERVRIASGERRAVSGGSDIMMEGKFGEIGKVGGTKRLFRRGLPPKEK